MAAAPLPVESPDVDTRAPIQPDRVWLTVVWNDPVNLMSYVSHVFRSYFGYSEVKANTLMLQVHEAGRSVVSAGSREKMEIDVQAMHSYGLWATLSLDGEAL